MKRKYLGLGKTFYRGYKELSDEDFFALENEDISKMSLPDRINLHFKIGNYIDIPISSGKEQELVDMIAGCETFEDVIAASEALYTIIVKKKRKRKRLLIFSSNLSRTKKVLVKKFKDRCLKLRIKLPRIVMLVRKEVPKLTKNKKLKSGPGDTFDDDVRTVDTLSDKLKELISKSGIDNIYAELPKVNLDTIIAKNSEIHEYIDKWFNLMSKRISRLFLILLILITNSSKNLLRKKSTIW